MLKNQLTILWRTVWGNKTHSFLNIISLAVGITCTSFIFLWVENEMTFNHNIEKRNSLFSVMEEQESAGKLTTVSGGPMPLAERIKNEISGIKNTARLTASCKQNFILEDRSFNQPGRYADSNILSVLNFNFINGNSHSLDLPQSIIISESMSRALFGTENPVGKTLTTKTGSPWTQDGHFAITGVFKDFPSNCTYQFKWLSPYKLYEDLMHPEWNKWNIPVETLIETQPDADIAALNKKLQVFLRKTVPGSTTRIFLFPMNDWNLYNHFTNGKPDGGNIQYIKLFSLIAIIILLIACINFMNLSTARSEKRAREVGIRKVSGALRYDLIRQFIGESLGMSFLSVILATILISVFMPAFNQLVGKELHVNLFSGIHLLFLSAIGIICGLLSGIYPAFYLSSFKPILVLKGLKIKNSYGSVFMRRWLVITQFVMSITLIISTVVIYQQIKYVKSRDLGYQTNNMIQFLIPTSLTAHFPALREELLNTGFVENAALSWNEPLHMDSYSDEYFWDGKSPRDPVKVFDMGVSAEYLSTMHLKIISGRDFYSVPGVDSTNCIINETLAKSMGSEGRIGGYVSRLASARRLRVVGIVKDFVFNDMYGPGGPVMLVCLPQFTDHLVITFKPGTDLKEAMEKTDGVVKASSPGYPFEYKFVNEAFERFFETENLIQKLAAVFSVLAISISCLGLFGLAAYTAEKRTKEIGIRKVLGASVGSLTSLLSIEFLKLVCISCIISFPLAWWALHSWLQDYQYRTEIHWWVFPVAGISSLLIALTTVSFQAIRVAISNPITSLRIE